MRYIVQPLDNGMYQIFDTLAGQPYGVPYANSEQLSSECVRMNALYKQQQGFSVQFPSIT